MSDFQQRGYLVLRFLLENAVAITFSAVLAWVVYGAVWRLYWSPIAKFPGPKLAALTFWYEFCYDIYPGFGQYTNHLATLHDRYGPIVRINPYELHIHSPPSFYETLYSNSKKRDKWHWFTKMFGLDYSLFATVEHDKHRVRRAAMSGYFSTQNVRKFQPVVEERIAKWVERLRGLKGTEEVHKILAVTSAFSNDVIMQYSFGRTYDRLSQLDFDLFNHESYHEAGKSGFVMKHFIWILRFLFSLPESWLAKLGPDLAALVELRHGMSRQIEAIQNTQAPETPNSHTTLFHALLTSPTLPPEEKTISRLTDEATTLIGAGQETVAWILAVIFVHLLTNPSLLTNLKRELEDAIPDPSATDAFSGPKVVQLPYLLGVVKEGLRIGHGITSRLQRVPHEPLLFPGNEDEKNPSPAWVIPSGTPVSMTSVYMHMNASVFPDPQDFKPERWMGEQGKGLDRYLVSFSRGSRMCLGRELAYTEMTLWLAATFSSFGSRDVRFDGDEGVLELVECGLKDVEIVGDRFVPIVNSEKGVRFKVVN